MTSCVISTLPLIAAEIVHSVSTAAPISRRVAADTPERPLTTACR
jgi:hypothetical protein